MYKASAGVLLPTSIIGSLPRPAWHSVQLGSRSFLEAMVNARWREQYEDAVSTHLRAQEVAGLDICTDGDAHYDEEIGGWSWQSYPLTHMAGFSPEIALPRRRSPRLAAARQIFTTSSNAGGAAHHRTAGAGNGQYPWGCGRWRSRLNAAGRSSSARSCQSFWPRRSRTITTRTPSSASGRSAKQSTRNSTRSPMPAAR